jgi:hypothetical protein
MYHTLVVQCEQLLTLLHETTEQLLTLLHEITEQLLTLLHETTEQLLTLLQIVQLSWRGQVTF